MGPSIDMFSPLPHSLLSTIVSLIPFKEAARTSILSKSWIDIFKSTSNIEFDEFYFVKDGQTCQIRQAERKIFLEFMTLWIANHKENVIDKFSLRLSMPRKAKRVVEKCIVFATKHGVKELELNFCDPTLDFYFTTSYINQVALFELPAHVYDHTFLKSLKLFSCSFVEAELRNFYALREISLGWMEVKLTTIKNLLSNCKVLESLSLKRCWNSDDFDLRDENLSLVIDVRSLVMEEEILEFCIEFEGQALFLYKLVEDVSGASVLTVGNYFLQVVPTGGCFLRMPRSLNVKSLIMKTSLDQNEFLRITFLLNRCSELEHLTIKLGLPKKFLDYELPDNFNLERFWKDHARAYRCMVYTLREVEIYGFKGSMNEFRVLTYFITTRRVLKKLTINISKDDVADLDEKLDSYQWDMTKVSLFLGDAEEINNNNNGHKVHNNTHGKSLMPSPTSFDSFGEPSPGLGGSTSDVPCTKSPYEEFKRSMEDMVGARLKNDEKVDWDFMEELLFSYMNMNEKKAHKFILAAYVDVINLMRNRSQPALAKSVRTVRIGKR
ncbi:putative F-box/LRR-repeat protein At1g56400 [Lotus japonicus]|uniref:putative F-box/LRR-repeat protein At1g56400 n=1 Tax=Lotus japonicus TaxID=34305 RepID=UPI0025837FDD|nr:putative F-box/LRR-repeat protein At1g56400 [Lotus japonicus]